MTSPQNDGQIRPEATSDADSNDVSSRREFDKMVAGELYDASDPELVRIRTACKQRCRDFYDVAIGDVEALRRIAHDVFAAGGDTVTIEPPLIVDYGCNTTLGRNVYFNANCVILDVAPVRIGSDVKCGPGVQIYTAGHPLDVATRRVLEFGQPITIGDDVWIGGGAIICPGVTIGPRSVIGAGSVVTRDIPGDVVAAGTPCRILRPIEQSGEPRVTPPQPNG